MAVQTVKYKPPKSLLKFFVSRKFINLVVGPFGSCKTAAGIMRIAYMASQVAKATDGIRHSRCVWVRNTRQQLQDTSIPDFLSWFPDGVVGTYEKTNGRFVMRFNDVECEVLFRPLEDANDIRRLLSLQISFAVMDEFREIDPKVFEALQGRLGRYPDKRLVPPRPEWGSDEDGIPIGGCVDDNGKAIQAVWGMTNPPDMETYWEEFLTSPPENAEVSIQPSGLSPEADWLEFLPRGYYDNLALGKSEEWIDVYVHAKFGKTLSGQPVFRAFDRGVHLADGSLGYVHSDRYPLIIGFDVGLHPAFVIGQMTPSGKLMVLHAQSESGMGALRFVRERLKPLLAQRFPGMPSVVILDPAAGARAPTDERTVLEVLRSEGFAVRLASTNKILPRLSAVDAFLTRMIDGKPGIMFDPINAAELVTSLAGKYRYKLKKSGDVEDTPEKLHPWSDLADALQYLCLHADTGGVLGSHQKKEARKIVNTSYRYV